MFKKHIQEAKERAGLNGPVSTPASEGPGMLLVKLELKKASSIGLLVTQDEGLRLERGKAST